VRIYLVYQLVLNTAVILH